MASDFMVTVIDEERAAWWREVLGTDTLCVRSPFAEWVQLPAPLGGPSEVYMLDLDELSEEQMVSLVAALAAKFGLDLEDDVDLDDVRVEIEASGVPILASDCVVSVLNPQKWLF